MPVETRAMAARRAAAAAQHHAAALHNQPMRALAALVHSPMGTDNAGVRALMDAHAHIYTACPQPLCQLYAIVGAPHAHARMGAPRSEESPWTLWSLGDMVAEFQRKRTWNPACVSVDFASSMHGMGHYVVASLDLTCGEVYLRLDGGSDGWAAELNFQLGASYKPTSNDCHTIEWWLDLVRQGMGGEALHGLYVVPQ